MILPSTLAVMAYHRYFAIIVRLEYPSAFNVPICVRCSSTCLLYTSAGTLAAILRQAGLKQEVS